MTKTDNVLSFKEKLNNLRDDAARADWTKQGVVDLGKGSYLYITLDQMKAVFNPLFAKNRLIFTPTMSPPTPLGSASAPSAWIVHLSITIEDVDSDDYREYDFYGTHPKLNFAISFAEKSFFSTVFLNSDGTNPDEADVDNSGATYVPARTPAEKVASISKLKEASMKPNPTPKVDPVPTPATDAPVAEPVTTMNTSQEEASAQEPSYGADIPETTAKAITSLLEKLEYKSKQGELSTEEYDEVKAAVGTIKDKQSANMFIIKYRKLAR